MTKHQILSAICFLVAVSTLGAVELREYRLTVDPQEFDSILANPHENIYINCAFVFNGDLWDNARVRLRGESSREYPKKSYKINFDADNRFFGRDKVNLVSCWTDASFVREHLSYDLYERAGLYASRTWFVKYYVNDVYMGLYLDIEQIDEHYLDYTDLPDGASIYKADEYGALLNSENLFAVWDKKTNEDTGFDDLIDLRSWLHTIPTVGYYPRLERRFDPVELTRLIAVNAFIGNSSTYYHNYYLIHDVQDTDKWRMLPWDMDQTFYFWDNSRQPEYYRSGHQRDWKTNPLIRKAWFADSLQLIYSQLRDISDNLLSQAYYTDYTDELRDLLYDAIAEDTLKQFTTEQFVSEIENLPAALEQRRLTILNQIESEPSPFMMKPTLRTEDGYFLPWTPAISPQGEVVIYDLWISHDLSFGANVEVVSNITEPGYLYTGQPSEELFWRVYAREPNGEPLQSINYFGVIDPNAEILDGTVAYGKSSSDLVWNLADSPYLLPTGFTVSRGTNLTIEAGIRIRMGNEEIIHVGGGLRLQGNAQDSIIIEPLAADLHWRFIQVDSADAPLILEYTSVRMGGVQYPDWEPSAVVEAHWSELIFRHCDFQGMFPGAGAVLTYDCTLRLNHVSAEIEVQPIIHGHFGADVILVYRGKTIADSCWFSDRGASVDQGDLIDIDGTADSVVINACVFDIVGDDGIDLDNVIGAVISNCIVNDVDDNGISLGNCQDIHIYNTIVTNCTHAFNAKEGTEATIYNSVFAASGDGILTKDSNQLLFRNCILTQNQQLTDISAETDLTMEFCAFQNSDSYPGEGNLTGELRLSMDPGWEYHPLEGSPLIDAGYGPGSPRKDMRDSTRIDDPDADNFGFGDTNYVDIGAFEFFSGESPPSPPVPVSHMFVDNFPNPFNASTTLRFHIVERGNVELVIFDRLGRRVFSHVWFGLLEGTHSMIWNGRTDSGGLLASGLYFLRLKQKAGYTYGKLVLIR